MLIDVHGHLGTLGSRATTAEAVAEYAEGLGLARVLVSNLDAASGDGGLNVDEPDANVATLDACLRYPILAPLYWIRPGKADSNLLAFLGAMATEPFAGIVLAPGLNGFSTEDERLDDWIRAAGKAARPVLVLCGRDERSRPQRALALARRHPSVNLILSDFGGELVWRDAIETARAAAERTSARVFLTTAHRSPEEIKAAVKALGHEKLLLGTDALVDGASHATNARQMIDAVKRTVGEAHAAAILGGTAAKLFGLATPAAVHG